MNNEFIEFKFFVEVQKHLFKSEIEEIIRAYITENELIVHSNMTCERYIQNFPNGYNYCFVFKARHKNEDDKLREQLEYQISNL